MSTVFPQLPRASLWTFRLPLLAGAVLLIVLGATGLFPLGLIAAAVLVPLLVLLYVYAVDVYEDEPARVVAFTVVVAVVLGVGFGILERAVAPGAGALPSASTGHRVLVEGLLLGILGVAFMAAGPLVLLPYRKFNDVLDGATFGATAAVTFTGAEIVARSTPLLSIGLHPVADAETWVYRLLQDGVTVPLVAAGAIGGAGGALWLRYRAPARDRKRLGLLGSPIGAPALAFALIAGVRVAPLVVGPALALLWSAIEVVVAMLWLRVVIHVGLVQEAIEARLGETITCANCGGETPSLGFCAECGVALKALPKARRPAVGTSRAAVE